MKNTFLILTIIVILPTLFSCSDDDGNNQINKNELLLGTWQLKSEPHQYNYFPDCNIDNQTMEVTHINVVYRTTYGGNNTTAPDCQQSQVRQFLSYFSLEPNNNIELKDFDGGNNAGTDYIEKYNIISISENEMIIELYYLDPGFISGNTGNTIPITIPEEDRIEETWAKLN
jgi:hypothetical protein